MDTQRPVPRTPHWIDGRQPEGHGRRYASAMINAAVTVAQDLGLADKRRQDLADSDFGDRVAEAWYRTEHADDPWLGRRGWPDAHPNRTIDYSTPERLRAAEIRRLPSRRRDDRIIDMTTPGARDANNRGEPIYVTPRRT